MKSTTLELVRSLSCDACPAKCRLEVGANAVEPRPPAADYCMSGKRAAWVDEGLTEAPGTTVTVDEVTSIERIVATPGSTLLACFTCPAPCLVEVSGPAEFGNRCVLSPTRTTTRWYHVIVAAAPYRDFPDDRHL